MTRPKENLEQEEEETDLSFPSFFLLSLYWTSKNETGRQTGPIPLTLEERSS